MYSLMLFYFKLHWFLCLTFIFLSSCLFQYNFLFQYLRMETYITDIYLLLFQWEAYNTISYRLLMTFNMLNFHLDYFECLFCIAYLFIYLFLERQRYRGKKGGRQAQWEDSYMLVHLPSGWASLRSEVEGFFVINVIFYLLILYI